MVLLIFFNQTVYSVVACFIVIKNIFCSKPFHIETINMVFSLAEKVFSLWKQTEYTREVFNFVNYVLGPFFFESPMITKMLESVNELEENLVTYLDGIPPHFDRQVRYYSIGIFQHDGSQSVVKEPLLPLPCGPVISNLWMHCYQSCCLFFKFYYHMDI